MFDGWSPREVHEHFDADGNFTGQTIVRHEPLWDDADRARAIELYDFDRGQCPCGCGQQIAEASVSNPNRGYRIETYTCYARKALETAKRQAGEQAERTKKPDGWNDGVIYYVAGTADRPQRGVNADGVGA